MIIFIKNLTNEQIKIESLNLILQVSEIRKIIGLFNDEQLSIKNELTVLVDDKKIEIMDSKGNILSKTDLLQDTDSELQVIGSELQDIDSES